jgi:histidinol-phosphatase
VDDSLMEAALDAARIAGDVAFHLYRKGIVVETKADGSPVTAADRGAEAAARAWIERRFPDDGVEGEEMGTTRPQARRRWLIDPIDGTKAFVRGVPLWGSLIAVLEGEDVVAGAAHFPAMNESICAAPGAGCWWNGARSSVSSVAALRDATVLTTDARFPKSATRRAAWNALERSASIARAWGDCYGYLLVATGRAEVMADDVVNAWDAAPWLPIIEEAGGVFTDWRGRRGVGIDVIATNASLAGAVRSLLQERK